MEDNTLQQIWENGRKILYPHLMSSLNLKFKDEDYLNLYKNNLGGYGDKMFKDFETIFKRYGIKSVDLTYNLFNTNIGDDEEMRVLKHEDIFRKT